MSNFDEFKQKAKDTMETIADKSIELYKVAEERTKLLAKTTKLSTEITLEKGSLRRLYRQIGQKYYELHKLSPETELEQACTEVTSSLERIASKQQEIEDLKKAYEDAHSDDDACPECKDIEVEIIIRDIDSDAEAEAEPAPASDEPEDLAQAENISETPPQY